MSKGDAWAIQYGRTEIDPFNAPNAMPRCHVAEFVTLMQDA